MGLIERLKANGFSFNKSLGQNFIVDEGFLSACLSDFGLRETDAVIEVGAGAGTLTKVLSSHVSKVYSFEIDKRLEKILLWQLENKSNVQLIIADALKYDFSNLLKDSEIQTYKVIANIPYYITTPLLLKFIADSRCTEICVLVQEELGKRIVAKHGTKDYGALSITMQAWGTCKIIRRVPRHMFVPPPNVDSVFVQIIKHSTYEQVQTNATTTPKIIDFNLFSDLVKGLFSFRRKTIANALSQHLKTNRDTAIKFLSSVDISADLRPEDIQVEKFINLANSMSSRACQGSSEV